MQSVSLWQLSGPVVVVVVDVVGFVVVDEEVVVVVGATVVEVLVIVVVVGMVVVVWVVVVVVVVGLGLNMHERSNTRRGFPEESRTHLNRENQSEHWPTGVPSLHSMLSGVVVLVVELVEVTVDVEVVTVPDPHWPFVQAIWMLPVPVIFTVVPSYSQLTIFGVMPKVAVPLWHVMVHSVSPSLQQSVQMSPPVNPRGLVVVVYVVTSVPVVGGLSCSGSEA